MTKAQDAIDREKALRNGRGHFEETWQSLANVMLQKRADITTQDAPGSRRTQRTYDGTPGQAARGLASSIDSLLKPKTSRWFGIKSADEKLNEQDDVKRWLQEAENRMYRVLYNPRARFLHTSGEVELDLAVFGTGYLFSGLSTDQRHMNYKYIHLKNGVIARNADGIVDTMYLTHNLKARQAEQKWGREGIGPKTRELLNASKPDEIVPHLQVVQPREGRNPNAPGSKNMPFESLWIEVEEATLIAEGGFEEFPFMVPVWDVAEGEDYGRSPGWLALPDSNTLQTQTKTLLTAGQRVVDPPMMALSDSVIGVPRTFPSGFTYFSSKAAQAMNGRFPIQPMDTGGNIPLGREMQQDSRDQIWAAFFRNVLQLPIDRPQMTATEVLERKEEFIRVIGPVFGRLESDYPAPMIERQWAIMMRRSVTPDGKRWLPDGAFPEPPDELKGADVRFEYASPVERARKQIEAAAAARSAEVLTPYIDADPTIMDNFDGDVIARSVAEANGMPLTWMRSPEDRDKLRAQRAAALEKEQQMQDVERVAGIANQVGDLQQVPATQ